MDKTWMNLPTDNDLYIKGIGVFLDFSFSNTTSDKIPCPCLNCNNHLWKTRGEVEIDLLYKGIVPSYVQWDLHGEEYRPRVDTHVIEDDESDEETDDMHGLLQDALGPLGTNDVPGGESDEPVPDEPNEAAKKFYACLKDAQKELYPECKNFSKLSFTVKLLHIKCLTGMSQKAVNMILELLNEAFPEGVDLPKSHYQAKKITRDLGLNYEKIDACRNDCVLFWKDFAKHEKCPHCNKRRWKSDPVSDDENENDNDNDNDNWVVNAKGKKIPHKILRDFPLTPRLQRLYMSKKTASSMRWHYDERPNDGVMRHPADSQEWKNFDEIYKSFASEPRNVRLGLASDGMNPFGNMSISHSTWPVVLVPYNLPPWMCMKRPYFMLNSLIPGPTAPGNDIDVYLQPLIDELKELWYNGVETFDALKEQNFQLHAMLLWTINDFPAYANLSGWSTKGRLACPICLEETDSTRLKHGGKHCYMSHRRFLPHDHKWRAEKSTFNGKKEERGPPNMPSGNDIFDQLSGFDQVIFGKNDKKRKRDDVHLPGNWKKKSIFFELPYYKDLQLRHNLDPMHIAKNICDIFLGLLMNVVGRTKDNLKARLDLQEMGIRKELHPTKIGDRYKIPSACYMFTKDEKQSVCDSWKKVKVSDGFSSNISRCVNTKDRKISGLKSHDCHVILQHLLPFAVHDIMDKEVREPFIEMGQFFKMLCSRTCTLGDLDSLQPQITETLCKLERILPPSCFVIMLHLPIHLIREAKLGGPVQFRWMYPIERFLGKLKSYTQNRAHPEGSIAEGYIAEECLTFCSRYLSGIETVFNRPERNYDGYDAQPQGGFSIFSQNGIALKGSHARVLSRQEWRQARLYVLMNCDEVQPFIDEHKAELARGNCENITEKHREEFPDWFQNRVLDLKDEGSELATEDMLSLAQFPYREVLCHTGYKINGFRFHTKESEGRKTTQNSGVTVKGEDLAEGIDYYGVLHDVIELKYVSNRRVTLFKCSWYNVKRENWGFKKDKYGIISVNTEIIMFSNQPFVLASQSSQVFYVENIGCPKWDFVVKTQPRNSYNVPDKEVTESNEDVEVYQDDEAVNPTGFVFGLNDANDVVTWERTEIPAEFVNADVLGQRVSSRDENAEFIVDRDDDEMSDDDVDDNDDMAI